MNWKLIIVGGLVFYVATFVLSFVTGPVIHNGILKPLYGETAQFWRPELAKDPPDMAALLPIWIPTGIFLSLVTAALYSFVRPSLQGPPWKRGALFGLLLAIYIAATYGAWFGVFNLPAKILVWWSVDGLILNVLGGIALGVVADKVAPASA